MDMSCKPAYWAVIPAKVRYDNKLPASAKLLYAEITALADATGYCWGTNQYFADLYDLSVKSVQRILKVLADQEYITVVVDRDESTNEVCGRRIYVGINPAAELDPPHLKNKVTPSPQKCGDPHLKNKVKNNINNNIIPPIVPQGGRRERKRKEPREHPDWQPDRFEGFWRFYPQQGRKAKQSAMNAWDKLKPSDELIATIGFALVKQKASDDWQRGIGIPYASTYLNQCRWEDAAELTAAAEEQTIPQEPIGELVTKIAADGREYQVWVEA